MILIAYILTSSVPCGSDTLCFFVDAWNLLGRWGPRMLLAVSPNIYPSLNEQLTELQSDGFCVANEMIIPEEKRRSLSGL